MTTIPLRVDNSVLLVVVEIYQLGNSYAGNNWVIITAIDTKYVYASGYGYNHADLKIPIWKFDDLLAYPEL